ncbi:MAG: cytochrome P450 [Deltaproteobacteria bacterium]|nr:cytochrome P450 [Deltaproteobacteria bacterium]
MAWIGGREMSPATVLRSGFNAKTAPGPEATFDVRGVLDAYRDPLTRLFDLQTRYGDVVRVRFGWLQYFLINDPEGVRHVLVENHRAYKKSRNYDGLRHLLGNGLLTSEGEAWRQQRKLAQPAFHRERLAGFAAVMARCTEDLLERWSRADAGKPVDLHREMMRLTFRVVGLTLLSAELDGEAKAFGDALNVALEWGNQYVESLVRIPLWVPTRSNLRFRQARRVIDDLVLRIIAERRALGEAGDDLLGMLMSARGDDGQPGMSDQQLRDELVTLVLAGHETTANALSFTLYLLSRHPMVRARVEQEVAEVLGGRAPTWSELPRLGYVTRVIEESMRLYPPAWIIERDALEDDVVAGYRVPKGATVGFPAYTLHRHPEYWSNPEGFDPDRFDPALAATRPKHAYLPFGGGPRTCIGNAFAMMEMQVILPMIVQRFRLDLAPGFRLELDPSITLRPKRGIPVKISERSAH